MNSRVESFSASTSTDGRYRDSRHNNRIQLATILTRETLKGSALWQKRLKQKRPTTPARTIQTQNKNQEQSEEESGPRAVDFETATAVLTDVFDIDGRRGETITDLRTTETDEGRQLVATVENSRSTMLSHRLSSAKQTGRRIGSGAAVLAVL